MKDFLTNCQDSILTLFNNDSLLKQYNWEEWDSDKQAEMPRAFIEARARSDLNEAEGPFEVTITIVLQGKPKRQKLSAVMHRLELILRDPNFDESITNNNVKFYANSQEMSIAQAINGDIRERRIEFMIAAIPLLYVGDQQ